MKKIIILAAMFGSVSAAQAQELRSKRGEYILPEAKDYAIGIDATPFLNYFGNFFGKTTSNNAPTWNFLTRNQTITGKYFVTPSMAYRGTVRLGFGVMTEDVIVPVRGNVAAPVYPALPAITDNSYRQNDFNLGLSFGFEKRRGFTRLQGFYGAEAGLGLSTSKATYEYGNALNAAPGVNRVDVSAADALNGGVNLVDDTYGNNARVTSQNFGTIFEFGVRGFVGAEYFVLPKISVAGEFGWGLGIQRIGSRHTNIESIGLAGSTEIVGAQEIEAGDELNFRLDTDNLNSMFGPSGTLRINLHF